MLEQPVARPVHQAHGLADRTSPPVSCVRERTGAHIRRLRLVRVLAVVIALLAYLGVDLAMLAQHETTIQWNMSVNAYGVITWIDPDGPASSSALEVGDQLLFPAHSVRMSYTQLATQPVLRVRHNGKQLTVRANPVFGPTNEGQALVLVGVPFLLIGGLAWAFGRGRTAPALLGALSAATAASLLADAWGYDGVVWAIRLVVVAAPVGFPVAWAALFLSFPQNRLHSRPWRELFVALCAWAGAALIVYVARLLIGLPDLVQVAMTWPVFPFGLLLGLAALGIRPHLETRQERQQRRLLALSAAASMLPFMLLSFMPDILTRQPLVPYSLSAFGLILLPLGFAYAILRYDLMQLDMLVRRLVATLLATLLLLGLTLSLSILLRPLLPRLDQLSIAVAVLPTALVGSAVSRWSQSMAERVLSPEMVQSRKLVTTLDPAILHGAEDLPTLAEHLETAARTLSRATWCQVLVRRRVPGSIFAAPQDQSQSVSVSRLTALLARRPWGVGHDEEQPSLAREDWDPLLAYLDATPAVVIPISLHDEVIGLLAVGERSAEEPIRGPDREALSLLVGHFALPLDHARVRTDLEGESADAAALSEASTDLTAALGDWETLLGRIVATLAARRGVKQVALVLSGSDREPTIAAHHGDVADLELHEMGKLCFATSPKLHAWLPLLVGSRAIGAIYLGWDEGHAIGEHDRRLLTIYAGSAAMALEHARVYEQTRIQAERDPVTNLYNHRAFHVRLEAALERASQANTPLGLLLIDLANFKLFNDTYGHQAGDNALQRVAEVLQACCRASDAAARLGGDEFAVLLPDANRDAAHAIAERITDLAALSAIASPDGGFLPVRLSIGVAAFPEDASGVNALMTRADERMYEAKRAGIGVSAVDRAGLEAAHDSSNQRFGILEALVEMVDNRDRYTAEHSEQVATYACALGAELGLSRETLETLRAAGLLHDVGKIGVPDRILRKPGRLTDEEVSVVRRHVELSEALLTVVTQDRDLMDAVRHHHERWDGQGYPRGIAGEDVPLLGRIMIVADAVSAMGMDRPYRKGLSWDVIAQELMRGAGAQFDPALVGPALRALRSRIERANVA